MADQQTMSYQDATDHLVRAIFAPTFFEKLASDYGIRPTTEDEANELLVLAGKLQQLDEANQVKQASARTSFVSKASSYLDAELAKAGIPSLSNSNNEAEIKEAAAELAKVQHIREAALLFQDSMKQLTAN